MIGYKYSVDNKFYYGLDNYEPHLQNIEYGDSVQIIYSSKDPSLNEALQDDNKLLLVKPVIYKRETNEFKDSLEKDDFYLLKDSIRKTKSTTL